MKELGSLALVPLSHLKKSLSENKKTQGIHVKTKVNYTRATWVKCKGKVLFKRLLFYCVHTTTFHFSDFEVLQ